MATSWTCNRAAIGAGQHVRLLQGTVCQTVEFKSVFTSRFVPCKIRYRPFARIVRNNRQFPCSATSDIKGNGACETFTLTTPLYYVNAAPHMGSAYPTIAADVLARFQRLNGKQVRFLTGTDEHGEKIALAAEKRGMSPQEHCDDMVQQYKSLWEKLDIKYDTFVRTTEQKHEALVAQVVDRVWSRDDIYRASYKGWYCVDCEEYKDEADMDEQHNCPIHRRPCSYRSEDNYFFRLSRYQRQLEDLLENNPDFVSPSSRRNEVLGWVKEGVRDFSMSRAAVEWGIPLPRDPQQTVYVWFDALNGYISGLLPEDGSVEDAVSHGWPADVHIIGKDILRFHAVYWPGMLMSAGLPLPKRVFGHGFLTKDGLKMGKSLGNVIDPVALVASYGADAVRYYFMKEVDFGKDGDFSEERFRHIVNAHLANDVGNLLNRTINLLKKNCGGVIPVSANQMAADHPLRVTATDKVAVAAAAYVGLSISDACGAAIAISSRGNQFLEETAPWTALKKGDESQKAAAAEVLVAVIEAVRVVAVVLAPVIPGISRKIYIQLGFTDEQYDALTWDDAQWGQLSSGHVIPKPQPVFMRLEGDFVTQTAPSSDASVPVAA